MSDENIIKSQIKILIHKSNKRKEEINTLQARIHRTKQIPNSPKIVNELNVSMQRFRQIKNYLLKVNAYLDGMSFEEVEKKFPPVK